MAQRFQLGAILAVSACAPMLPPPPQVAAPAPRPEPVRPAPAPTPAPAQPTPTPAEAMEFDAWRESFLDRRAGADRAAWARELAGLTPDMTVVSRDRTQPEFSRSAGDYITRAVTDGRVAEGRRRINESPWMASIERRYGVPRELLVAVWANESGFGRIQGDSDVVRSLATLAWEGRRRAWAEGQLADALDIITSGKAPRSRLKGSWAGAMGQTQFMPDNYLRLAQDGNGDGVVDIWGSEADSLASAANLLARAGWKPGQAWAVEVTLPEGFDYGASEEKHPWSFWQARGVRRADGAAFSSAEAAEEANILLPQGAGGPAFLALPNHYVIRRYNNSVAYALAIGLTADGIAGRPGLTRAWPVEEPLGREQRLGAQRALAALGYDPGGIDGVIGTGTRNALRRFQVDNGLLADGHLNAAVAAELQRRAAAR
ncbi:MAG TPA: lytic murein transglycosylase, partial [Caulobacteraceae bacterium]|jgi:lytic murein transglycosylase